MLGVYCVQSPYTVYIYMYVYTVCWVSTMYGLFIHTYIQYSMLGVYCVQSPYTHCTYIQYVGCLLCTVSSYIRIYSTVCWVSTVYSLPIHSVYIYVRIYSMLGVYCVQSPYTHCTYIQYVGCLLCTVSSYIRIYSTVCWVSTVYNPHTQCIYICTYIQYVGCLLCTVSSYIRIYSTVCWVSTVYSLPIHTVRIYSMLGVYYVRSLHTYVYTVQYVGCLLCTVSLYTLCTYIQYVGCLLCTLSIHMLGHSLHDSYEEVTILCPPRPSCTCLHIVCYYVYCILCIVCCTEGWV